MPDAPAPARLLVLTAEIVSAHAGNNELDPAELPGLIRAVHDALAASGPTQAEARPEPAVPVRRSVFKDAVVCLECGLRFRSIKRHLATEHGLTPEQYRARWGLSRDYPMVAPDYAAIRSRMAKQIGLGRKGAPDGGAEAPEPVSEPLPTEEPAPPAPAERRGRRKAAAPPDAG